MRSILITLSSAMSLRPHLLCFLFIYYHVIPYLGLKYIYIFVTCNIVSLPSPIADTSVIGAPSESRFEGFADISCACYRRRPHIGEIRAAPIADVCAIGAGLTSSV